MSFHRHRHCHYQIPHSWTHAISRYCGCSEMFEDTERCVLHNQELAGGHASLWTPFLLQNPRQTWNSYLSCGLRARRLCRQWEGCGHFGLDQEASQEMCFPVQIRCWLTQHLFVDTWRWHQIVSVDVLQILDSSAQHIPTIQMDNLHTKFTFINIPQW